MKNVNETEMQSLSVTEYNGIRVLTSKQLAEEYGTTPDIIGYNYRYNKNRFIEGKHYILLVGQELKGYKITNVEIQRSLPKVNKLYLWTQRGALLHAKSLNTDKAWEVYEYLVDYYFRGKEQEVVPQITKPVPIKKPTTTKAELPQMDNPIKIFKVLLKTAEEKGVGVDSFPFRCVDSALKGKHIGINTGMMLEKVTYELAWELAHFFIHYDGGDMVEGPLSKHYNEQATRAADMIISMLNVKVSQN